MALSELQRKYLRGLGHELKPIVFVGNPGITDNVLAELDVALEHHELIKVRLRVGDRARRDVMLGELVDRSRATLLQRIGNIALLYREAEEAKLVLP